MAGRDDTAGRDETKSRMWGDWCLDNRVVAPALQQAFAAVMALVALSPVRLVAQRLRLWFSAAGTKYLVVLKPECLDGTHPRSISSLLTDGSTLELNLLELPANPPAKVDLARRNAESLFPPRAARRPSCAAPRRRSRRAHHGVPLFEAHARGVQRSAPMAEETARRCAGSRTASRRRLSIGGARRRHRSRTPASPMAARLLRRHRRYRHRRHAELGSRDGSSREKALQRALQRAVQRAARAVRRSPRQLELASVTWRVAMEADAARHASEEVRARERKDGTMRKRRCGAPASPSAVAHATLQRRFRAAAALHLRRAAARTLTRRRRTMALRRCSSQCARATQRSSRRCSHGASKPSAPMRAALAAGLLALAAALTRVEGLRVAVVTERRAREAVAAATAAAERGAASTANSSGCGGSCSVSGAHASVPRLAAASWRYERRRGVARARARGGCGCGCSFSPPRAAHRRGAGVPGRAACSCSTPARCVLCAYWSSCGAIADNT